MRRAYNFRYNGLAEGTADCRAVGITLRISAEKTFISLRSLLRSRQPLLLQRMALAKR